MIRWRARLRKVEGCQGTRQRVASRLEIKIPQRVQSIFSDICGQLRKCLDSNVRLPCSTLSYELLQSKDAQRHDSSALLSPTCATESAAGCVGASASEKCKRAAPPKLWTSVSIVIPGSSGRRTLSALHILLRSWFGTILGTLARYDGIRRSHHKSL
jgi:hypothetical protein